MQSYGDDDHENEGRATASSPPTAAPSPETVPVEGNWLQTLHRAIHEQEQRSRAEIDVVSPEVVADERFRDIIRQRAEGREKRHASFAAIPRFFFPKTLLAVLTDAKQRAKLAERPEDASTQEEQENSTETPAEKLHRIVLFAARSRLIQRKSMSLLDESDLSDIARALAANRTPHPHESTALDKSDGPNRINYDGFCQVREAVSPRAAEFFTPDTFLKFDRDAWGRISTQLLFQYFYGRVAIRQARIQLSTYDTVGDDALSETELENYVFDMVPTIPSLDSLQQSFVPFYVYTAVRKFRFFVSARADGRTPIRHIASSRVMAEFLALQRRRKDESEQTVDPLAAGLGRVNGRNWFSADNAIRVYSHVRDSFLFPRFIFCKARTIKLHRTLSKTIALQYIEMDTNHDGMLGPSELALHNSGSLTPTFVKRLFQEKFTYSGEMDFKAYLDFVIAMENKRSIASMRYLFDVLDQPKKGYLSRDDIAIVFQDIQRRQQELGQEMVTFSDLMTEILDLVQPSHPDRISFQDLIRCRMGHFVIHMLIDIQGFWMYENRDKLEMIEETDEALVREGPTAAITFGEEQSIG